MHAHSTDLLKENSKNGIFFYYTFVSCFVNIAIVGHERKEIGSERAPKKSIFYVEDAPKQLTGEPFLQQNSRPADKLLLIQDFPSQCCVNK